VTPLVGKSAYAVGHRALDTTALSNGVHTIAWIVSDRNGLTRHSRRA